MKNQFTEKQLTIGEHCFVHRPEDVFGGKVTDIYQDRVRVAGGTPDCFFDEWFPIWSRKLQVTPA